MKRTAILVPHGAVALGSLEGSLIGFNRANDVLHDLGEPPMFEVRLIGTTLEPEVYDRSFQVRPDLTIHDPFNADLVIIPAVNGNWDDVIESNREFFPWIIQQYQNGAELASLCVGAFLLAATGLVNGKRCSTHWMAQSEFQTRFPKVKLMSDAIVTQDGRIFSSGGATSFWNLIVFLIELYAGREVAIICAKIYEIEFDRETQCPFSIFEARKDHNDPAIRSAQLYMELHFPKHITVEELADHSAMTRRTFERRFKRATTNTVIEYLQRIRIEAAKKRFEHESKGVMEVMFEVGYTDTKAFRSIFKRFTGLSPVDYRNKYLRTALPQNSTVQ